VFSLLWGLLQTWLGLASLILANVALAVTVAGFAASVKFYLEGMRSQQAVQKTLAVVDAKVGEVGGGVLEVAKLLATGNAAAQQEQVTAEAQGSASGGPELAPGTEATPGAETQPVAEVAPGVEASPSGEKPFPNPMSLMADEQRMRQGAGFTAWRLLELWGYLYAATSDPILAQLFQLSLGTGFYLLYGSRQRVLYYGHFYKLKSSTAVVANTRILVERLDGFRRRLLVAPQSVARDFLLYLIGEASVMVLAPEGSNVQGIRGSIEQYQAGDWKLPVTVLTPSELKVRLQREIDAMKPPEG